VIEALYARALSGQTALDARILWSRLNSGGK